MIGLYAVVQKQEAGRCKTYLY